MERMNSGVVLSLVLLLVATSVLSTGFGAASYCYWDPVTNQNVCVGDPSELSQPTAGERTFRLDCQKYPNYPNCPKYPSYQPPTSQPLDCHKYPNYPNCPKYPSYQPPTCRQPMPTCKQPTFQLVNCPRYPYYSNYANYPYYYPIADPPAADPIYEDPSAIQTVTATSYSFVTQTSEVTSIAPPVTVTTSATATTTMTTRDTTAETLYGTLMAVFLALFLASLVLLVGTRYRGAKSSNPQPSQGAPARPRPQAHIATSYKCSACGAGVDLGSKFCVKCGAALIR